MRSPWKRSAKIINVNKVSEEAKDKICCPTAQDYVNQNTNPGEIQELINWCNCTDLDFSKYDCSKIEISGDSEGEVFCEAYFEGVYFDEKNNKCVEAHTSGCSNPFLFISIE